MPLGSPLWFPADEVHIILADMDGDGDEDLFVFVPSGLESPKLGDAGENIQYYENTSGSGIFRLNTSAALLPLADMPDNYFPILGATWMAMMISMFSSQAALPEMVNSI
jgi:hypothetical protein